MDREAYLNALRVEYKTREFWRDVCVEMLATFILMSVQCALPLQWGPDFVALGFGNIVQIGIGMGFVVCATAWTFGDFGGCHMNPAVTVAMMTCAKMTFMKGSFYIIAQCIGAMVGACFIYGVTPSSYRGTLAATVLNPSLSPWQGMLIELWLTFILVCTILGATNEQRKGNVYMPTIIVGFVVTVGVLSGSAQTGASMNPARSLGPAVVMGIWNDHWIYWVGTVLGGILAALVYHFMIDKVVPVNNKTAAALERQMANEINNNLSNNKSGADLLKSGQV